VVLRRVAKDHMGSKESVITGEPNILGVFLGEFAGCFLQVEFGQQELGRGSKEAKIQTENERNSLLGFFSVLSKLSKAERI